MKTEYKSKVYTDRPAYADFDAPRKFEAVKSIIAKRLIEHPNAICSYSGGSDSDIMIHLIEDVRKMFGLPPVQYCFFNTGLEMEAIKRHVRETSERYGVMIAEHRPKKNIVMATREYGLPFVSKIMSAGLEGVQKKNIPLTIADELYKGNSEIDWYDNETRIALVRDLGWACWEPGFECDNCPAKRYCRWHEVDTKESYK